jgi:hypothetical protein
MTETELLSFINPAQLNFLKQYLSGLNTQSSTNGCTYTTNDYSLGDLVTPSDATEGSFYIILKPDERLNEAGLLTIRFSLRCEGSWSYTHIDHGTKELQFSIDDSDILLAFRYKSAWTPDRWIEHKGEPKRVPTM